MTEFTSGRLIRFNLQLCVIHLGANEKSLHRLLLRNFTCDAPEIVNHASAISASHYTSYQPLINIQSVINERWNSSIYVAPNRIHGDDEGFEWR